jgi:hypothetical protein
MFGVHLHYAMRDAYFNTTQNVSLLSLTASQMVDMNRYVASVCKYAFIFAL